MMQIQLITGHEEGAVVTSDDYADWPYLALMMRACEHLHGEARTRANLVNFFMQQPPPFSGEPITRNDAEALAVCCLPVSARREEDDLVLAKFSRAHRW
jgi:hypothetical protein